MPSSKYSLSANDAVVLVMGETGAGKSTFIEALTGRKDVGVGEGLGSGTLEVGVFPSDIRTSNGKRIILVDTPGVGNADLPDSLVLERIAIWLAAIYQKGISPTAILVLRKIDSYPLTQTHQKELAMFRNICGDDALENVVLVSTMWDAVNINIGAAHHAALRASPPFWYPLLRRGSQVTRFYNTPQSAQDVIQLIRRKTPVILKIQRELVDGGKHLDETSAGLSIARDLEGEAFELQQAIDKLEERMRTTPPEDVMLREEVKAELAMYKSKAQETAARIQEMKKSPLQKIWEAITRFFGGRKEK